MKKMNFLPVLLFVPFCLCAQSKQSVKPHVSPEAADSFYFRQDWNNAKIAYETVLKTDTLSAFQWYRLGFSYFNLGDYDQALNSYNKGLENNPSTFSQTFLYSRMARIYALKNDHDKTLKSLDKAITAGYFNFSDMDTLKEFSHLQQDEKFKALRNKAYAIAYPCSTDPKAREFDFWVGEWDAYPTGSNVIAGHSIIQIASGGCMILENWTSAAAPFSGKSMNFIDQKTGKWEQVWVGSSGGGANIFVNGEYRDSAMHFDFEQTDQQGNKLIGRFTFFNQGPNQVRQLNETSSDEGKTWSTVYDFTYIRKKN